MDPGTALLTVVSGTIVYSLGQLFLKLALEPAVELRRVIGEVDHAVTLYADLISNLGVNVSRPERIQAGSECFRDLASELRAKSRAIPWYQVSAVFRVLPRRSPAGLEEHDPQAAYGGAFVAGRALDGLEDIFSAHPNGRVAVCTHGDTLPALLALLAGRYDLGSQARELVGLFGYWHTLSFREGTLEIEFHGAPAGFPL